MKKTSGKIIKEKPSILEFYKFLTKWICNRKRTMNELIEMMDKYDVDNAFVFNRILSLVQNSPHIIWYINQYLNKKFNFNTYSTNELMNSLTLILDTNYINNSSLFIVNLA